MAARALTWSFGGGTQSVALAVLVAQGRLPPPDLIVMADTGREAAHTWAYHQAHTAPLLATVGLTVEIAPHALATVDLYAKRDGRTLLPMYTGGEGAEGALGTFCSGEWKARVVRRFLRGKGYGPRRPVDTWLGMSLDETPRLKASDVAWQRHRWPLCFDVPLTRAECRRLVLDAGLPAPPRSRCWMCPFQRNAEWRELRDHAPEDWRKAVALEAAVRARDPRGGALYLHEQRVPLDQADLGTDADDAAADLPLFAAGCATGHCWT